MKSSRRFQPPGPRPARAAYTLVEMLISTGALAIFTLVVWTCVDVTFTLTSRNTALNVSHTSLQYSVDRVANQLREAVQVIDVAKFDGATFTHAVSTTNAAQGSTAGNAVRFARYLPGTFFLQPDNPTTGVDSNKQPYSETNPQDPFGAKPPDNLTPGNKTVKATFAVPVTLDPRDLTHARLLPRYPYMSESVTTGPSQDIPKPGVAVATGPGYPFPVGTAANFTLVNGWPSNVGNIPSCNQAFLVIESAFAVLNRTTYSELVYYPDASDLTRSVSVATSLSFFAADPKYGPAAFSFLSAQGGLSDLTARGSLCITLPVRARDLDNAVLRHGTDASLANAVITLPVEVRRRAQF